MSNYYSDHHQDRGYGVNNEGMLQYRFLIPQPAAGGIIGRKGENIKRLRADYGVDVSVPASDAPERLLILTADGSTLRRVMEDVLELVKDCMHAKVNDPKEINSGIMPDGTISPEMDLRFLVSENVCGAIIGKGGESIRRLTDTYRVTVFKVYQQMCPQSTDRVIRLVGLPEDILNCLEAIHEIILGLKDVKSSREYDPNHCNELHAVNYGGWVSNEMRRQIASMGGPPPPTKGPNSRSAPGPPSKGSSQFNHSYQNVPSYPPTDHGYNSAPMQYYPHQQANMMGMAPQPPQPLVQPTHTPSFAGIPIGHMADYAHPENIMIELQQEMAAAPAYDASYAAQDTGYGGSVDISHVSLPNKLIGAIMGRGGCRINDIREATGARIDVDKDVLPDSDERVITIQGTREQIQHAQILLQQNVKKYGGKR